MTQQGWKVYTDAKDLQTYKSDIDGKLKDQLIKGPIIIECEYWNHQNGPIDGPIDEPVLLASPKSLKLQSEVFKQLHSAMETPFKFEILVNGKEQYWYNDKGILTDNAPMNGDETYTFKFNPEGQYRIPKTRKFTVTYKFYEIPDVVQPGGGNIRGVKPQASLTQTLFGFIFNKNLGNNLKSIILSQQLNVVDRSLFDEFPLLENIEFLSEDVLYLNEHSFIDCQNLTDISFMTNCKLILQPDCDIVQNCPNIKKSILEKFKGKVNETTPEVPIEPEIHNYDGIANGHPYIEINGIKWSIINLGATQDNLPGLYYLWANKVGYINSQNLTLSNDQYWDPTSDIRDPYWTKYNFEDGLIKLQLEDDVANYSWGDGWRIPTVEEFNSLISSGIDGEIPDGQYWSIIFNSDNNKRLRICSSGYVSNNGINSINTICLWTSDIHSVGNAYILSGERYASVSTNFSRRRNLGLNIRPVFDDKIYCLAQLHHRVVNDITTSTATVTVEITQEEAEYLRLNPGEVTFSVKKIDGKYIIQINNLYNERVTINSYGESEFQTYK